MSVQAPGRRRITVIRPAGMSEEERSRALAARNLTPVAPGRWKYFWVKSEEYAKNSYFSSTFLMGLARASTESPRGKNSLYCQIFRDLTLWVIIL